MINPDIPLGVVGMEKNGTRRFSDQHAVWFLLFLPIGFIAVIFLSSMVGLTGIHICGVASQDCNGFFSIIVYVILGGYLLFSLGLILYFVYRAIIRLKKKDVQGLITLFISLMTLAILVVLVYGIYYIGSHF